VNEKRRPATGRRSEESAASVLFDVECTHDRPEIAEQWDRSRAVARRLPPMPDGRRNPFSKRRTDGEDAARIELGTGRSARIFGIPNKVLDEINVPHMRDPIHRKITLIPLDRVDDVLAWVEHRHGIPVTVIEADPS
jgi:hypothetical protein